MKIVHFSWEFPPVIYGGLGTFATEITQKQVANNHEVTVFSLNEGNKYKTKETWKKIEVYRPNLLDYTTTFPLFVNQELQSWGDNLKFFTDVVSYSSESASYLVNDLINKKGRTYDIIDAHDWLGIMGGMIAKKQINLPLIFHVHSTETGRSMGGGSPIIKNIEYEGGQKANGVITVSYAMREELIKLGFPSEKIRVCWNGIDPKKYDPETITPQDINKLKKHYHIQDDETVLFFVGRLVTVKGVDKLVRAMPQIVKEFPKTKLIILGIGDMEQELKQLAKQLHIEKHLIFRNEFISEKERILHYAAADVVVLPSLYEPFGIVCTEGMSMAKPVVVGARGTSGMREQVLPNGHQQSGVHVNPNDPNDIAWGITKILEQDDKGKWIGKNARERVINQFSWESVTQRTLKIYEEFLTNKKKIVKPQIAHIQKR